MLLTGIYFEIGHIHVESPAVYITNLLLHVSIRKNLTCKGIPLPLEQSSRFHV